MVRSPAQSPAAYLLLPLMWVNLTVAENHWAILGLGVGQALYWIIIALAWYVAFRSPYQRIATVLLLCAFVLRPMEAIGDGAAAHALRIAALAGVFTIAGAWIYGRAPNFLHRQLVVFLGLCVPVMLLQMLGVGSWAMFWSTSYLHDPNSADPTQVGTFTDFPLYATLFVPYRELVYSIGQARPVGLMHASNILSIFVSIAVALNFVIPRTNRLRSGDLVVTAAVVLTMSKMVFGLLAMVYVGALLFAPMARKVLALKLLFLLAVGIGIYYLLFPGLLETNLSEEMVRVSIMVRLLGVLNAVGIENLGTTVYDVVYDQTVLIGSAFKIDESYSTVATLISSGLAGSVFIAGAAVGVLYFHRLRQMRLANSWGYAVLLFVCVATQFAIPFAGAASFQLIMGLALYPLFPRLWRARIRTLKPVPQVQGPAILAPSTR